MSVRIENSTEAARVQVRYSISMRPSKKYSRPVRPLNTHSLMGGVRYEKGRDGEEYKVRHIPQGAKDYVCPGCDGVIPRGQAHEVVWSEDTLFGAQYGIDNRRHWHTSCWQHRGRA